MPRYNRGGKSLVCGDIGRLRCLRQHLLLPGERMQTSISGHCRLGGLREQTSVYLHSRIDAFAIPLRWLVPNFTDYIQEGLTTSHTIPTLTGTWTTQPDWTTNLGIGRLTHDFAAFWAQAVISVWNEWYRWPEDARENVATPDIAFFQNHGKECVNLPSPATRLHDAPSIDTSEKDVGAVSNFDVRQLAYTQALFNQAATQDWTSQDRYMSFLQDIWRAQGSREVDKVPIKLRDSAVLSVNPRDMYATDSSGLGEVMSINNFGISHKWDFVAPEHMVVGYYMLNRFQPIFERPVSPMAYPDDFGYEVMQGDPIVLGSMQPQGVKSRELNVGGSSTIGYLPAGWQWRDGHDHVDERLALYSTFPLLDTDSMTLTASKFRDASDVGDAFRSLRLRHWFADIDFNVAVDSMVPPAGSSIVSNLGNRRAKGNHPTGGYVS